MSMESAKAFVERLKTDEDFRNKVTDCKNDEAWKAFVKQAGYEFTKDDMELLKAELTEDDLDGVAGGKIIKVYTGKEQGLNFSTFCFYCIFGPAGKAASTP
ncbi:MAG: Nif11-like leader peptide family natural product precursor [Candidatus Eremiobacterota bacterium]